MRATRWASALAGAWRAYVSSASVVRAYVSSASVVRASVSSASVVRASVSSTSVVRASVSSTSVVRASVARGCLLRAWVSLGFLSFALGACGPSEPAGPPTSQAARADDGGIVEELRRFEAERRAAVDFERAPPSDRLFGPDPYVIRALGGGRFVGLLRGADVVVLLDADLREVARADAPVSASGLAVAPDGGSVFVVGERASLVRELRVVGDRIESAREIPLAGVRALRDVAVGPGGVLHVVEEVDGTLLTLVPDARAPGGFDISSIPVGAGAFRVARTRSAVLVACLNAHTVSAFRVDAQGRPSGPPAVISNDGPLWSFAALEDGATLLVASGGVENRPLDRTHGSFENIDSFVYLDRFAWPLAPDARDAVGAADARGAVGAADARGAVGAADARGAVGALAATRIAEVNVSEHGVVTPKAIALSRDATGVNITTAGHGSGALAAIRVADDRSAPIVTTRQIPPGTSALAQGDGGALVLANPLLDAWVVVDRALPLDPPDRPDRPDRLDHPRGVASAASGAPGAPGAPGTPSAPGTPGAPGTPSAAGAPSAPAAPARIVPVPDPRRAERTGVSRLGEALIFTTLIAPWNHSKGPLSRFTCETCHFEGYGDGRTHATGRGAVRATTKPLLGLFNNRPHFSRALDPDLSAVAHAEFRVAGARSDHEPVFDLTVEDNPWLAGLGVTNADLSAVALRRAFMTFLMEWSHRSSALGAGRTSWSPVERRGAELFRDHCESCHEARLASDVPASRAPFETWERHVLSEIGPVVWGQARYAKTGPAPYVHDEGARVPSLRRLYKKGPYFTTGAAKTLPDLLARVRLGQGTFFHDSAPADPSLRPLTDDERTALHAFLLLL